MNEPSASAPTCPRCAAPLAADAPEGLCPRCLVAVNLATATRFTGAGAIGAVPPPPTPAELAPLFPQLEILSALGRGGMGVVYKARQPALDRVVALKVLSRDREGDPQFASRFQREAQSLARLNHPGIVTVHDFGETAGLCYLVMEFVDGSNLRDVLRAGKLSPAEALAVVPKLCDALQYAHEQGIVHRDIKPENILLDRSGRVKITDFGIAKILGVTPAAANHLTGARDVLGTPHYMAPEQIERPQAVDHRADIYSLGVVFYEMLTGELPLGKFAPPSGKVQVDVRLDEVVLRTLEKEPELRFQQVSEVKTRVETIAQSPAPTAAPPPAAGALTKPQPGPTRAWLWILAGLFVSGGFVVVLTAVILFWRATMSHETATRMEADRARARATAQARLRSEEQRRQAEAERRKRENVPREIERLRREQQTSVPVLSRPRPDGPSLVLDLTPFFQDGPFSGNSEGERFAAIRGRHIIDGVPLHLDGETRLWGRSEAEFRPDGKLHDALEAIGVESRFTKLCVVHATHWPDVEGQIVATFELRYADGSAASIPVRYGVHVRDWFRHVTEPSEAVSDPASRVIWRGDGDPAFDATARLFYSELPNPYPEKPVASLRVVSGQHLASYKLLAVTATGPQTAPRTPALGAAAKPARILARTVTARLRERGTDAPAVGLLIEPTFFFDGFSVVGQPQLTTGDGVAVFRFEASRATQVELRVTRETHLPESGTVRSVLTLVAPLESGGDVVMQGDVAPANDAAH